MVRPSRFDSPAVRRCGALRVPAVTPLDGLFVERCQAVLGRARSTREGTGSGARATGDRYTAYQGENNRSERA